MTNDLAAGSDTFKAETTGIAMQMLDSFASAWAMWISY